MVKLCLLPQQCLFRALYRLPPQLKIQRHGAVGDTVLCQQLVATSKVLTSPLPPQRHRLSHPPHWTPALPRPVEGSG